MFHTITEYIKTPDFPKTAFDFFHLEFTNSGKYWHNLSHAQKMLYKSRSIESYAKYATDILSFSANYKEYKKRLINSSDFIKFCDSYIPDLININTIYKNNHNILVSKLLDPCRPVEPVRTYMPTYLQFCGMPVNEQNMWKNKVFLDMVDEVRYNQEMFEYDMFRVYRVTKPAIYLQKLWKGFITRKKYRKHMEKYQAKRLLYSKGVGCNGIYELLCQFI